MSKRNLQRIEVLTEVLAGRRTKESAAGVLSVSVRQTQRFLAKYGDGGGAALIHRSRGGTASNRLSDGVREYVLELVRQKYRDFGPTLAAKVFLEQHGVDVSQYRDLGSTLAIEALYERHGIKVGRETLRTWMLEQRNQAGPKLL